MDTRNEKNHVFNIKLAKLIGLYQILDPGTAKYRGRNVYHIIMVCILLYMSVILMILNLSGLYYWTVNMPISIDYFWKSETTLYVIYKIWIVINNSNDIWNYLSTTRYDFTSFSNRNRYILDRWRERSVWLTTIYAIMYFMSMITYMLITLVFMESLSPVKNHDGSVGYYRQNIMNFYLIVSDETYNAHYFMFYIAEALYLAFLTISFLIFDILLVTLCFGISCQMQMICSAFESVGYTLLRDPISPIVADFTDENKNLPNEHDVVYVELKRIIMDHQAIMKKYEDFLALFRRVMLLQIFMSTISVITLWFIFIMSFSNDDRFKASEVVLKKMFCSIPPLLFQIFMVCYLFDNLHNQKDSTVWALYCSNWTEMDMKCKKLILLTMKMNNANHKKLKFTRTKIVNLEMFFKTMGDCYTIVSVLVNYIQRNVE